MRGLRAVRQLDFYFNHALVAYFRHGIHEIFARIVLLFAVDVPCNRNFRSVFKGVFVPACAQLDVGCSVDKILLNNVAGDF